MYRCERSSAVVLLLGIFVGCGRSGGTRATDAGLPDAAGSLADSRDSDAGGALPDAKAADLEEVRPDAGKPDLGLVQPDSGERDVLLPPADVGADIVLPQPDGSTADLTRPQPDGNIADRTIFQLDGGTADTAVPQLDGRAIDTGSPATDAGMSKDEIVVACAWAASCAGPGSPTSASQCIAEFAKTASRQSDIRLDRLLACATTKSCSEFRACWGGSLFYLASFVTGGVCSGNDISLTLTGVRDPLLFDCTAMGGTCARLATSVDSAGCNTRPCEGPDKVAPSCDGTIAGSCGGWTEYTSLDCAGSGRICRIEGNYAVCAGSGAACAETEKVTCAGSAATYCSLGARAAVDCAKNQFATRCAAGAAPSEPCAAAGTECDPLSYRDRCDGTNLEMCVDGSIASVDCLALGFGFCDLPSIGYARCWEKR